MIGTLPEQATSTFLLYLPCFSQVRLQVMLS